MLYADITVAEVGAFLLIVLVGATQLYRALSHTRTWVSTKSRVSVDKHNYSFETTKHPHGYREVSITVSGMHLCLSLITSKRRT